MKEKRILVIGAHPDDADIRAGGTSIQLIKAGHKVKFVSLSNGNGGHHKMKSDELAARRYNETQKAREVAGLYEYQVLRENNDCELEPSLTNRKKVMKIIREFAPDVVLSHRLCDYHADHRAAAQIVQDCAYLTQVPLYCPETPIPDKAPVFGCVWDAFEDPRPFRKDAVIPIDDVIDEKCHLLDCQVSQFYEWLAWEIGKEVDPEKMTWEERKEYLLTNWGARYERVANEAREALIAAWGEKGKTIRYAEAFELSPYGRQVTQEEFRQLLLP